MDIKKHLKAFIEQNIIASEIIEKWYSIDDDFDELLMSILKVHERSNYNTAYGILITCLLQLSNKEENFNQYELEDVSDVLYSLLKVEKSNIDIYVEIANFEYAVMDNNAKAKEVAILGIEEAQKKINELNELLIEIEKDNMQ